MTLGKWEKTIDPAARENYKALVHEAIDLGVEKYRHLVLEAAADLLTSDTFQYLAQTLVVGNLAFDAQTEIKIGEEDYNVTLNIEVA